MYKFAFKFVISGFVILFYDFSVFYWNIGIFVLQFLTRLSKQSTRHCNRKRDIKKYIEKTIELLL